MPKANIGILITYYNERELLIRCLESIRNQTVLPDEIIIYDDASDFPARDYTIAGLHIEIIRGEENRGLGFARNSLLKASKCEYVHSHDADDFFEPRWCEKVRDAIERERPDIIITEIKSFDESRVVSEQVLGLRRPDSKEDLLQFAIMSSILPSATVFKREIALNIGGYRTREIMPRSEGYDFHVRMINRCERYSIILEPLVIKYLHKNALGINKKLCFYSIIKSIQSLEKELSLPYHKYFSEYSAYLGSQLFYLGAITEAREAFSLSLRLGKPRFVFRRSFYRILAGMIGPLYTEYLCIAYRRIIPRAIRGYFVSRSW